MARIACKTLGDVTEAEHELLDGLTLQGGSGMREDVLPITSNLHEFQVFLAREDKAMLGWAVVFPYRRSKAWPVQPEMKRYDYHLAYFFINPEARGKGIGQQLFGRVRKYIEKYKMNGIIFPWDERSRTFFTKCLKRSPTKRIENYQAAYEA